jgi:hypothetical protein
VFVVVLSRVGHVTHDVIAEAHFSTSNPHETSQWHMRRAYTWCLVQSDYNRTIIQSCPWCILSAALRKASRIIRFHVRCAADKPADQCAIEVVLPFSRCVGCTRMIAYTSALCALHIASHPVTSSRRLTNKAPAITLEARLHPSLDVMVCSEAARLRFCSSPCPHSCFAQAKACGTRSLALGRRSKGLVKLGNLVPGRAATDVPRAAAFVLAAHDNEALAGRCGLLDHEA